MIPAAQQGRKPEQNLGPGGAKGEFTQRQDCMSRFLLQPRQGRPSKALDESPGYLAETKFESQREGARTTQKPP